MKKLLIFILLLPIISYSDELSVDDFVFKVLDANPMSTQADLEQEINTAKYLKSKGYFDPKLFTKNESKFYDGKNYYDILKAGVELPSWLGTTFYANYSFANGAYVNNQSFLPDAGMLDAGFKITLGRGLLIDERRKELFQGRNFEKMGEFKKIKNINELILMSKTNYYNWNYLYELNELIKEIIKIAQFKHDNTVRKFESGDSPAIDTLETFIQLQKRQSQSFEFNANFIKSTFELVNNLWSDSVDFQPQEINKDSLPNLLDRSLDINSNPMLTLINYEIKNQEIEKDFAREQLKPQIDLTYNILNEYDNINQISDIPMNYKWKVNFSFPVLLRKELGSYQIQDYKHQSLKIEYDIQKRNLDTKLNQIINNAEQTLSQIAINNEIANDYYELLQAEIVKFNAGESSVLIVNIRENYYMEARIKLLDLIRKYLIYTTELEYYQGTAFSKYQ